MWLQQMDNITIPLIVTVALATISFIAFKFLNSGKRKKWRFSNDFTAAKHNFQPISSSSGIATCNVCNIYIAGFWSAGARECLKCGIKVHSLCQYKHKDRCKSITTSDLVFNHQWVETYGNKDFCQVCQLKSIPLLSVPISTCLWCQRAAHRTCLDKMNKECDCGRLSELIIRPTEIKYNNRIDKKIAKKNKPTTSKDSGSKHSSESLSEDTETETEYTKENENAWILNLKQCRKPTVVVINKRSGGQLGLDYLKMFYSLLNPIQVIDLIDEGLDRLKIFTDVINLQLVVGGGDGTIASVMNYLKSGEIKKWAQKNPPVAVLPLGTGNDLGRCLGWGGGSEGAGRVFSYLQQVSSQGQLILLDRWDLKCSQQCLGNGKDFKMYNYFSIGLDAKTCLNFHKLREKYPSLFVSRIGNKFIYSQIGAADMFVGNNRDLSKECQLEVDGKIIEIPPQIENIVFLNITSWAGGASNVWPIDLSESSDNNYKKQSLMDGTLEIIGISSVLHLGQVQTNISKPIKIAQGSKIKLSVKKSKGTHAFQIDGEPFELHTPVEFQISLSDQVNITAHKSQQSLQPDAKVLEVLSKAIEMDYISEQQKSQLLALFTGQNVQN